MANKPLDTQLLDRAIVFAVKAHAGTERRGKGFPYIVHPMEAVEIVATMTPDQELLAAAALHDTVEDTYVSIEDIRAQFGDRVARLVEAESDVFMEGVSEEALPYCEGAIELPQEGTKHSLNVSVCAGIVMWKIFEKLQIGAK